MAGPLDILIPPMGLPATLDPPRPGQGVVVFAHGSGSSRLSPRNRHVAASLRRDGHGTLLFDLLTEAEAGDRRRVFDIDLLAERLLLATAWLQRLPGLAGAPIGYFGASTGAAAALAAAARSPRPVAAVVSRGGRPDLAGPLLAQVRAPVLLIVGGADREVLELNRAAFDALTCDRQLEVVPGAGHLFEEPGTLDTVIDLARAFLAERLAPNPLERTPLRP